MFGSVLFRQRRRNEDGVVSSTECVSVRYRRCQRENDLIVFTMLHYLFDWTSGHRGAAQTDPANDDEFQALCVTVANGPPESSLMASPPTHL